LELSHDALQWLKPDHTLRQDTQKIQKYLTGTMPIDLLVRRKDGEDLSLDELHGLDDWLNNDVNNQFLSISARQSVFPLIREMHFHLSGQYNLPSSLDAYKQELLLLDMQMSRELSKLIQPDNKEIRITFIVPWDDARQYGYFLDDLKLKFDKRFPELMVVMTGMGAIGNSTLSHLLDAMLVSYLFSFLMISILMVIIFRRPVLGLALMLPNLLPISLVMALMYLLAVPLDLFTMIIGCIALGLIVDDAVHLVHSSNKYLSEGDDVMHALKRAISSTGLSLLATSAILVCGFLVYGLSSLTNVQNFGLFAAFCIAVALVCDLVIMPALMFKIPKDQ